MPPQMLSLLLHHVTNQVQRGFHQDFQLHTCRNRAKGNNNNADGLLSDEGVVFVSSVVGGV